MRRHGEVVSPLRFCSRRASGDPSSALQSHGCAAYAAGRPFDDRHAQARRHPGCAEWSDVYTGRPFCSETAGASLRCVDPTVARQAHGWLYCSKPVAACTLAAFGVARAASGEPLAVRTLRFFPAITPTNGLFCEVWSAAGNNNSVDETWLGSCAAMNELVLTPVSPKRGALS